MKALIIIALWAMPTAAQSAPPAELLTYEGPVAVVRKK